MNLVFCSGLLAAKRAAGFLPKKGSEAGEGQNESYEEQQLLSLPLTHPSLLRYKHFPNLVKQNLDGCHLRFCLLWGTVYNEKEKREAEVYKAHLSFLSDQKQKLASKGNPGQGAVGGLPSSHLQKLQPHCQVGGSSSGSCSRDLNRINKLYSVFNFTDSWK